MKDFAAIDFETANNERSSVCSVGVVIVRDGEIVDSFPMTRSINVKIRTRDDNMLKCYIPLRPE